MEVEARALTAQLSKAESNIAHAAQSLEKAFKDVNQMSASTGVRSLPDPIKLVRRLTALEIALGHLKDDCEIISKKRAQLVNQVVATQTRCVSQVNEILELTEAEDPYSIQDDIVDESWNQITQSLKRQDELFSSLSSNSSM